MAPLKKDHLDKLSWSWADGLDPNDIQNEQLELVYKIRIKVCGNCRKNCSNNPRCLHGLGEHRFLNKTNIENKITSEDKKEILFRIRSKNTFVGLRNLGATCYMNSLLQVWFHNPNFRNALYKWNPLYDNDEKSNFVNHSGTDFVNYEPKSVIGHLQLIFALLEFSNQNVVDPSKFVNSLMIDAGTQQDLQEFSKLFMSLIENKFIYQEDDFVKKAIFDQYRGQYSYVTRCQNCQTESKRGSHFFELELNIKNNKTINDCIKEFLIEEKLENQDQYFCGICQSKQNATRSIELDELPPILNLQLLRFVYDIKTQTKKKLSSFIQFPEILDMSEFIKQDNVNKSKNNENLKYKLTAVLIHNSISAYSGHYVAHIFVEPEKTWYKFNDEVVEEIKTVQKSAIINLENNFTEKSKKGVRRPRTPKGYVSSNNAYMLVYKLMECDVNTGSAIENVEQTSSKSDFNGEDEVNDVLSPSNSFTNAESQKTNDSSSGDMEINSIGSSTEIDIKISNGNSKEISDDMSLNENILKNSSNNTNKSLKNQDTQKIDESSCMSTGSFELISDDIVLNSNLPKYLKTLVLCENRKFSDEIKNLEEMQNVSTASLVAKQAEIKYFYDEVKNVTDSYEFIPREWLQKWFLMESNVPAPISNKNLLCVHGNLNPLKINSVKIVSKAAADHLYLNFGGGPRLTNDNLCLECVKKKCELNRLKSKIMEDQKIIQNAIKKPDLNETSYWIGKYSFRNWKRFVLDQFKEMDQSETTPQSPSRTPNSQADEDESKLRELVEETKSDDNTTISEECMPNENQTETSIDEFNCELFCQHNSLCTDESERKLIPKKVYDILLKYFPNLKSFDMNSTSCETCTALETKSQLKLDYYMNIAVEQKEVLKDLFLGINRPTLNQLMPFSVDNSNNTFNGDINKEKNEEKLFSDNVEKKIMKLNLVDVNYDPNILIKASVPDDDTVPNKISESKLSQENLSDKIIDSKKSDEKLYVIATEFVSTWKKFLRNNGKYEFLDTIENSVLICNHGKLLYYPNSEKMVLLTSAEWTTLRNYFSFDNEIEITKSASSIVINPEICKSCAAHNITYKIIVRKISADLEDDNLLSDKEPPPKKVKLKTEEEQFSNNNSPSNHSLSTTTNKPLKAAKNSKTTDSASESDLSVRRSKRRKIAGNERHIQINSNCTLKDLKLKIMEQFQVAPFDQNLTFHGKPLTDNSVIISDLGFYENCVVTLKADEPNSEQTFLDELHCNQPEEGFKGTGLLS